jgi:hypothetical protein
MNGSGEVNPFVRSYLTLRKAIGYLGIGLPPVLVIGTAWLGSGKAFQPSISDYYATIMRGVFVGVLFAVGVFLYSYKGYLRKKDRKRCEVLTDNAAGNWACLFALGVALFPTTSSNEWVVRVHFMSATALFLILAYFSGCLFTKSNKKRQDYDADKVRKNRIYTACAGVMLACIALIAVNNFFLDESLDGLNPVFWLESVALWAFGISWFAKGRAIADGLTWFRQRRDWLKTSLTRS